jgi:hypothetical protein
MHYQAPPMAERPRPVFWAVLCSVLAAAVQVVLHCVLSLDWRRDSDTALRLVIRLSLLFASACSLMERISANLTRPITPDRPPGDALPTRWASRQPAAALSR